MKCPTCNSTSFEVSSLGPDRCTFCDGTEGGNPPGSDEVGDWIAETTDPDGNFWTIRRQSGFAIFKRKLDKGSALELAAVYNRIEALQRDQSDWRKGVDLIRSATGDKALTTLACVPIAESVLKLRARNEDLETALKDLLFFSENTDPKEMWTEPWIKAREVLDLGKGRS